MAYNLVMDPIQTSFLVGIGLVPSIFWLLFYLKKDCHPEPSSMIAKTFLMGIIVSPIAVILQLLYIKLNPTEALYPDATGHFFLWAAFVEETIKFYAVKLTVFRNPEFDEPVDAMVYMITAGLGFAAIENILVMFRTIPDGATAAFGVWTLRFFGAILLHALSSAILGYFLAISWFFQHHRKKLIFIGLSMATLFHFAFNSFLSSYDNQFIGLIYSTTLLVTMAFLVAILFDKIKERHESHTKETASL